ncbi:zf-TFIIB domain-containing protein [Ottowia testudinis]|uniref:Zf-TFIIB domain-containing protein n=1 Tax=Ottowia testudinis TaxID=2816950 RepID=A0A975H662_9BURK|nr:zf-TFIIB domain-containing protein [Ottowia testudinis]QTD45677.1 zf-TFIIB domain-containing protein [Ottowia testudinis]
MTEPLAPQPTACPSCRAPMQAQSVAAHHGATLELDLCHACHGIWFDGNENLRMAAGGVVDLFRHLHEHRDDPQMPLARTMACPRCRRQLAEGSDLVRTGRYVTWRCPQKHGRFSTFSSFMIEKGFVRLLTAPEIADLAERVRTIHCGGCGAPVDLRQHTACPYCRAAFSLLDPRAVERALAGYGQQAQRSATPPSAELAEALITLERDRARAQRQAQQERWRHGDREGEGDTAADALWAAGLALVWDLLRT